MSERAKNRRRLTFLAVAAGIGGVIAGSIADSNDRPYGPVPPHAIEVTNTSANDIEMSSNSRTYTPMLRVGTVEAGQKAMALCLTRGSDRPEHMGLRVINSDRKVGYIGLYSAGSNNSEGKQQLEPGFDQLKGLPLCHPPVEAKVETKVSVYTIFSGKVELEVGTRVTAECVSSGNPFNLQAAIEDGTYAGMKATNLPRSALEATTDPYGAWEQTPHQDPFGPLVFCTE